MKQFNLEEYLKNPSKKVVTRDGRSVRIICTDRNGGVNQPVVALCPAPQKYLGELVVTFCANGVFTIGAKSEYDLFFAPEKHEGWTPVYREPTGTIKFGYIYSTKKEAEEASKYDTRYITTTKVEWEE